MADIWQTARRDRLTNFHFLNIHTYTLTAEVPGRKEISSPNYLSSQPKISSYIMISRRNIRVKVMQTLYSIETMEFDIKPGQEVRTLEKHFDQSRQLFVYIIYFITEIARYSETAAMIRASKHLPTEEDLNVNTKTAGNEIVWKVLEDLSYQKAMK